MPELPEAETIVRGLRPVVVGSRVASVEVVHPDVVTGGLDPFVQKMETQVIQSVGRRGKNVVLRLDSGDRVVVNLGMSGRLLHREPDASRPEPTHPAVVWRFDGGGRLVYHDVRRFGRLEVMSPARYREWSGGLGPEPLGRGFTARSLAAGLARSISPVRQWLLDQRRVAGVGNIYANEALHRARVHPALPASSVPRPAVPRLHRAIRKVLREAIRARGTTLRDYRTAAGEAGGFGIRLRVYGRQGEPCPRCGTPIERLVISNRSAFYCGHCQPANTDAEASPRQRPPRPQDPSPEAE